MEGLKKFCIVKCINCDRRTVILCQVAAFSRKTCNRRNFTSTVKSREIGQTRCIRQSKTCCSGTNYISCTIAQSVLHV